MPCFNAEAFLNTSIACVFEQTYPAVELITVDDGSTDRSFQILEEITQKYPSLTVLRQTNRGPYPARNLALSKAKGDYVAFLDADDYWTHDCLQKLYDGLIRNNADLSYCGWQNIYENGHNGPQYIPPAYEEGDMFMDFLKDCPWPIHAALVKRSIVIKVGGFSTRCFSSMDYDFWIRISGITQRISRVPEVLAFYRWHDRGQISSIKWRQVLDAKRVKSDFIVQHPQLVKHISTSQIEELTEGMVLKQAYAAFWKRDLLSAHKLFRAGWKCGIKDLKNWKYILLSFLPVSLFQLVIRFVENK